MNNTDLPNRASDAGPEAQEQLDWRDHCYTAEEYSASARRTMSGAVLESRYRNRDRIAKIDRAIEALQSARELLCR